MNNKVKIKRLLAAVIDFYVICFLSTFVIYILTWGRFSVTLFSVTMYLILSFFLLLFKDFIFQNASVGKWIFKIRITKIDKTKVRIVDIVKRNVPILVLLPIELFLLLINKRRIGDIWAKTSVQTIVQSGDD